MAAHVFKIGGMDISNYARLAPGEGFDPADSGGYAQPGFIDTPYFEGQQLSSINVENRKMTIPLALSPWQTPPTVFTNIVTNPSGENDTTGWGPTSDANWSAASVTQSNILSFAGTKSIRLTGTHATTSTNFLGLAYLTSNGSVVPGQTYTGALWTNLQDAPDGAGALIRFDLVWYDAADAFLTQTNGTAVNTPGTGVREFKTSGVAPAKADHCRLILYCYSNAAGTLDVYCDAAMFYVGSTDLGHWDGDTDGCTWTGTPHASTSKSPANYTNYIIDPSFDTPGLPNWTNYSNPGAIAISQSTEVAGVDGGKVCKVLNGAVVGNNGGIVNTAFQARCTAGEWITISAYSQARSTTQGFNLLLAWGDINGNFLSATGSGTLNSVAGSWTRNTFSAQAPNNAYTCWMYVVYGALAAGECHYVDQCQLVRGQVVPNYFDGSTKGAFWNGTAGASLSRTVSGKDGVHALIQQLNKILGSQAPAVEWRDAGASSSSFTNLVFGRLDVDFNYWRASKNWEFGTLHLYVQPYTDTGTTRLVATVQGTGVAVRAPIASLGGDVPALAEARLFTGSQVPVAGRLIGISALKDPSYGHEWGAGSMTPGPGVFRFGASGAPGSQFAHGIAPASYSPFVTLSLFPASAYRGANRIIGVARSPYEPGIAFRAFDVDSNPLGPTSVASAYNWQPVDLGILRVPTVGVLPTSILVRVDAGAITTGTISMGRSDNTPGLQAGQASGYLSFGLSDILVLPEAQTTLVLDDVRVPKVTDTFPAAGSQVLLGQLDQLGNSWATSLIFGAAPLWQADPVNAGIAAARQWSSLTPVGSGAGQITAFTNRSNVPAFAPMGMRTTYAPDNLPSQYVALRKENDNSGWCEARIGVLSGSQCYLAILAANASQVATAVASMAWTPSQALSVLGALRLQAYFGPGGAWLNFLDARNGATGMALNYGGATTLDVKQGWASMGVASDGLGVFGAVGQPAPHIQSTLIAVASVSYNKPQITGFRAWQQPSRALAPQDPVMFDGILGQTYIGGGSWGGGTGPLVRNFVKEVRGVLPHPVPSTSAIIAFDFNLDDGIANDLVQAEIRVRERFFYSR